MSEWVKIQYLSWMLNNIYYVPEEKQKSENVFILFIFQVYKYWILERKKDEIYS